MLFPTYLENRTTRIRVDRIPSKLYPEWLTAAILNGTGKDAKVIQVTRTQQLNWWDFDQELFVLITEKHAKE